MQGFEYIFLQYLLGIFALVLLICDKKLLEKWVGNWVKIAQKWVGNSACFCFSLPLGDSFSGFVPVARLTSKVGEI